MIKAELQSKDGEKLSLSQLELEYLFEVTYKDGSKFKQNKEDQSTKDPKRSAFFDINHDEIKSFEIHRIVKSILEKRRTFKVDLEDLHFEVNGVSFYLHDRDIPMKNVRLIYFRRHRHDLTMGGVEKSHTITFHLGWQANDEAGNNHQHVIAT